MCSPWAARPKLPSCTTARKARSWLRSRIILRFPLTFERAGRLYESEMTARWLMSEACHSTIAPHASGTCAVRLLCKRSNLRDGEEEPGQTDRRCCLYERDVCAAAKPCPRARQ